MGAETDLPPPPPELGVRGHGDRSWKADMMSALGESASFGRFLSEPLDWGKWSAFEHNRYLEEAVLQARPGSVAQKKAMLEAHYARKRNTEADAEGAEGGQEGGDLAVGDAWLSPSTEGGSSCMTDDASPEQEVFGSGDPQGALECDGAAGLAAEEVQSITDSVGFACRMDEAESDEICTNREERDALLSLENHDSSNGRLVSVDAAEERQPLKECSIANQDQEVGDSAKKRRLQMPSLLQKPVKLGSPSSGKNGQSSSAKRRSAPDSSKENASPSSTDSSEWSAASVSKKRSALAPLHMSTSFSRCETSSVASSPRNLSTTVAERISQLQSASSPVENTQRDEFRPPRKVFSRALPEIAPRTSQVDEQRSSHVMRIKEKLFGSTSQAVNKKTGITREKEKKLNIELGFKESWQSFCFKGRPQLNFYWKNKQTKDSNHQNSQEAQHLSNSSHQLSNVKYQMGKGVCKEKQICCFPIRKLC